MLVLSRKKGEEINIGDDIVITVRRISGGRVVLGVDAPRSMRIVRSTRETSDGSEEDAKPAS